MYLKRQDDENQKLLQLIRRIFYERSTVGYVLPSGPCLYRYYHNQTGKDCNLNDSRSI